MFCSAFKGSSVRCSVGSLGAGAMKNRGYRRAVSSARSSSTGLCSSQREDPVEEGGSLALSSTPSSWPALHLRAAGFRSLSA